MKTTNSYHHNNAHIKSPSPNNNTRYRSREKDIEEEKVKNIAYNNNIFTNHTHPHSFKNQNKEEGKLYLANIPINIPQAQIKEEFEKYGHILDYSFRKKTDIPNRRKSMNRHEMVASFMENSKPFCFATLCC